MFGFMKRWWLNTVPGCTVQVPVCNHERESSFEPIKYKCCNNGPRIDGVNRICFGPQALVVVAPCYHVIRYALSDESIVARGERGV